MKRTKAEHTLVGKIVDRGWEKLREGYVDRMSMYMDIEAVHSNGCPLDLEKLLAFPEFDFYHELWGIHDNLDRKTGKLENYFLPRSSKH